MLHSIEHSTIIPFKKLKDLNTFKNHLKKFKKINLKENQQRKWAQEEKRKQTQKYKNSREDNKMFYQFFYYWSVRYRYTPIVVLTIVTDFHWKAKRKHKEWVWTMRWEARDKKEPVPTPTTNKNERHVITLINLIEMKNTGETKLDLKTMVYLTSKRVLCALSTIREVKKENLLIILFYGVKGKLVVSILNYCLNWNKKKTMEFSLSLCFILMSFLLVANWERFVLCFCVKYEYEYEWFINEKLTMSKLFCI